MWVSCRTWSSSATFLANATSPLAIFASSSGSCSAGKAALILSRITGETSLPMTLASRGSPLADPVASVEILVAVRSALAAAKIAWRWAARAGMVCGAAAGLATAGAAGAVAGSCSSSSSASAATPRAPWFWYPVLSALFLPEPVIDSSKYPVLAPAGRL